MPALHGLYCLVNCMHGYFGDKIFLLRSKFY